MVVEADADKSWRAVVYGGVPRLFYHGWLILRAEVLKRDRYKCKVRGCNVRGTSRLTAHHILPRKFDGLDIVDNLVALCPDHHDKIEEEWRRYSTLSLIENFCEEGSKTPDQRLHRVRNGVCSLTYRSGLLFAKMSLEGVESPLSTPEGSDRARGNRQLKLF